VVLSFLLACGAAPPLPDLVLVVVDTLRADALGVTGAVRPTSPHLDALAAQSAVFDQAWATSSWTLPSTISLLTGLGPHAHHAVRDRSAEHSYGQVPADVPLLAEHFKALGYRTGAFVNNAYLAPAFGAHRGFDRYDYEGAGPIGHRTAQSTVDTALAWLREDDQPALLWIHVMEPHFDYEPGPQAKGRFTADLPHTLTLPLSPQWGDTAIVTLRKQALSADDQAYLRAAYDEEVLTTDQALGSLLVGLRARPQWDRTTLAVTSDHGEEFWEHGRYEHGHTLLPPVTRVPLLLRGPGVQPGHRSTVVSLTDAHAALKHQGAAWLVATTGQDQPGRTAVMEGLLYGSDALAIAGDAHLLVVKPESREMTLHALGAGVTSSPTVDAATGKALFTALAKARGGLAPATPSDALVVPEPEMVLKLQALGYLE
jgi:arylsulfatase A-like enzyme